MSYKTSCLQYIMKSMHLSFPILTFFTRQKRCINVRALFGFSNHHNLPNLNFQIQLIIILSEIQTALRYSYIVIIYIYMIIDLLIQLSTRILAAHVPKTPAVIMQCTSVHLNNCCRFPLFKITKTRYPKRCLTYKSLQNRPK